MEEFNIRVRDREELVMLKRIFNKKLEGLMIQEQSLQSILKSFPGK